MGLVGVVVPVLPGSILVVAAILVWAIDLGTPTAWVVFAVCALLVLVGAVVKYVVPGRRLQEAGVPTSTMAIGGLLGVVGFFLVPVVGLPLGFVARRLPLRAPAASGGRGVAGDQARAAGGRALRAHRAGRLVARGGRVGDRRGAHVSPTVVLALGAALAYGVSDFVGGVVSRRTSVWPVAFTACLGGAIGTVLLAVVVPGDPSTSDLAWGLLAGVGSGTGTAFLYRGFATGRMGVVAPVSAVGAAVLPVVIGVVIGERPSPLAWLGILVALPGIWLVSREPAGLDAARGVAAGLADGILAGVGFGLLFAALGQVPDAAGFWPVLAHPGGLVPRGRGRRAAPRRRPAGRASAWSGAAWSPGCWRRSPSSASCWPGSRACSASRRC